MGLLSFKSQPAWWQPTSGLKTTLTRACAGPINYPTNMYPSQSVLLFNLFYILFPSFFFLFLFWSYYFLLFFLSLSLFFFWILIDREIDTRYGNTIFGNYSISTNEGLCTSQVPALRRLRVLHKVVTCHVMTSFIVVEWLVVNCCIVFNSKYIVLYSTCFLSFYFLSFTY